MPTAATTNWSLPELQPVIDPSSAIQMEVNLKASSTFRKGDALGEVSASPGTYGLYASGNSDGTQNPAGLISYACSTDGSGLITLGEFGQTGSGLPKLKTAPMYIRGYFNGSDLPTSGNGSLDATGLAKCGRMIEGTVTAGSAGGGCSANSIVRIN